MENAQINWNQVSPNDIANLIKETLSGNNQKIQSATKMLKSYTKLSSSIRVLSYLLVSSQEFTIRQMSTVLLKRNLVKLYQTLNINEQNEFKNILLTQFVRQSNLLVQKGIVLLIAMLLPFVTLEKWEELKNLLQQALKKSPQSPATFILLNSLLYHFTPPPDLYNYLVSALSIPKLSEQAMKCLIAVAETQDIDQSVAVKLIELWQNSNWNEDVCLSCFEVLTTMCQRKIKLGEDIVIWVCKNIVGNAKVDKKIRTAGLDFLFSYAEFNSKALGAKEDLLKVVVETACLTCSEPPSHHEEIQQQQEQQIQEISLWLIETLSATIKSKRIYPVLLQASISLIKSEDIEKINTGFLVLASISQGCPDRLKKNLQNPIMNMLMPLGLSHKAPKVRGAAINALCYFSQYLIPDIVQYHATLIPSMINHMEDLSTKVAEKAIIAVDVLFESMQQQQIKVYLSMVIPKLSELMLKNTSTTMMRKCSLSAIGSAILASGVSFEPFVDGLFKTCLQFLKINPSPQMNTVRAENISVLGRLCNIFCKKTYANQSIFFHTYIMPILQPIYQILLNQNDPQMREACFSFFYLLANAIEADFQFIFDKIIVQVLKGCEMKIAKNAKQNFSLDSDSEEDMAPTGKATQYDEKAAAIHALGELGKACPLQFLPYFEKAYSILDQNYQFFYQSVRVQVAITYQHLTLGLAKSCNKGVILEYKKGLPCISRYPQKIQYFFKTQLLPKLIFMITQDESTKVSATAIQAITNLTKQIGPALIDHSLEPIKETIIKLLEKSDLEDDDSQQQQEQEEDDTDVQIFETLTDFIPCLSSVLQNGFQPMLNDLYPYLLKFTEEREDINDNIQMIGCLSQCFKHTPGFVASHAKQLFYSINDLAKLNDTDLNRNIAYSFAEMFEKNPNHMKEYLQDALITLKHIFENSNSSEPCKDNTMAALCRITYTLYPTMPYSAFVQTLIQRMPFSGDEEEEPSAIKAIIYLWKKTPDIIRPHLGQLDRIFRSDLENKKKYFITGEVEAQINQFLKQIQ